MILRLKLLVCGDALKEVLRLRVDTEQQLLSLCQWRCLLTLPAVVDMAGDMDIKALLEKQVGELGMLMTALGQTETHVAEISAPGRFTVGARRFDLRPGTAMDLRTGFDFNKEADRLRSRECQTNEMPLLLGRSPRCAAFSQLQNSAKDSERWRALAREGMQHFFVCEMYKKQIDGERFFLHEQPAQASLVSCGWWATNVRSGCRAPMWRDQHWFASPQDG